MPSRDFFVFCTSLLPVELRAVGALSKVRHFPEGQTIYSPGDPADAFYIINRGIVDVVPAKSKGSAGMATFLSRGDIVGDLEALTEGPRRELARTRQTASLQCFERQDFDELFRRVPSFSRFLCQHLAYRLGLAREAAASQSDDLELSGNLANFDLVTIYQTIAQSSQTGRLSVENEEGELIGEFHFSAGQPLAGHFLHLNGEEAFWQIFLADDLQGTFSFTSGGEKWEEPYVRTIKRSANDMLFAALHFRDEFQALKREMPPSSVFEMQKPDLELSPADFAVSHFIMEEIWRCSSEHSPSLSGLFAHCSVCELKIYQTVRELMRTGHLALSDAKEPEKVA